jgi:hypothetical protein
MAETDGKEDRRTPFERMADMTARLLAVPKEELDRKQAEWEAAKDGKRGTPMLKPQS